MYLEVTTCGYGSDKDLGNYQAGATVFVGPFESEETRTLFREHWERQLKSPDHNANQVKFISLDKLPEGYMAILSKDFAGFQRVNLGDIGELLGDL